MRPEPGPRHHLRDAAGRRALPRATTGRRRRRSCSDSSSISKPSSSDRGSSTRRTSARLWCDNVRTMFSRMGATEQEVRTLRGIVATLAKGKGMAASRRLTAIIWPSFELSDAASARAAFCCMAVTDRSCALKQQQQYNAGADSGDADHDNGRGGCWRAQPCWLSGVGGPARQRSGSEREGHA